MGKNNYRVKKLIYIKNYKDGGIKMVSIKEFIMSLKLMWVKKIVMQKSSIHSLLDLEMKKLTLCGTEYVKGKLKFIKNLFWKDVLESWAYFSDKNSDSTYNVAMEPLFLQH